MSLPVTELGDDLVRLEAIPFMTEAANLRDVIKVQRRPDGSLEFAFVVVRSNWRTFTFFLSLQEAESPCTREFCSRLLSMGCYWELDLGGCLFVGVPPDLDVDLNDILAQARRATQ